MHISLPLRSNTFSIVVQNYQDAGTFTSYALFNGMRDSRECIYTNRAYEKLSVLYESGSG